eukprot:m.222778 g.222778  ORF g.222778 m.222778 type:complete len:235 (+) comp10814_c0_seq45:312-1016(+)
MSDKPQIIEHASKSLGFTLFAAKWVPSSARFVVLGQHARGTGALHVYELERGQLVEVTKVRTLDVPELRVLLCCTCGCNGAADAAHGGALQTEKPQAFKCCTFGASALEERHLATGDFAGNLMVWCVAAGQLLLAVACGARGSCSALLPARRAAPLRVCVCMRGVCSLCVVCWLGPRAHRDAHLRGQGSLADHQCHRRRRCAEESGVGAASCVRSIDVRFSWWHRRSWHWWWRP